MYLGKGEARLWALCRGAEVVGAAGVSVCGTEGEIRHIAVAAPARRKGVGRTLVAALCDRYPQVRRWRAETDDEALGFYRRLGFAVCDLGERYPGVHRYACLLEPSAAGGRVQPPAAVARRARASGSVVSLMSTQEQNGLSQENREAVRAALRHTVATIAYRAGKCLAQAPAGFDRFDAGAGVRTPAELVMHLTGLCYFAQGLLAGSARRDAEPLDWPGEIARFAAALGELDEAIAAAASWHYDPAMALQGPLADALTHVGQLAMLRRLAGAPVEGENYARAPIRIGRLTLDTDGV